MLTPEQQINLVTSARWAPSPHNIQPARWRFNGERVELYEDPTRWLAVGDPSGKDNTIALGAAWEGMSLGLSGMGLQFQSLSLANRRYPPETNEMRLVCAASVSSDATHDPLLDTVLRRRAHRRLFRATRSDEHQTLTRLFDRSDNVTPINDAATITKVAELHDAASAHFIRDPAFSRELYKWMRFSSSESAWDRDGLSAVCLGLASYEAFVARWLMRPAVVRGLCLLRIERVLVAESAKTRSAAALALFHVPASLSAFDAGRGFYRFWLELERAGFSAVPMSALVDSSEHLNALLALRSLPADRRLINVFRIGPRDAATAVSARLPANELIVK